MAQRIVTQICQIKSVFVYAVEFNCYVVHTGYNDTALMFIFEKSFKIEL